MARLSIHPFLEKAENTPIVDVRTPAEYLHGHIPGAVNIPLFTNEQRAIIGTDYKNRGKQNAMLQAMDFVGPRMRSLVEQATQITRDKKLLVHCWRGGMRSESVAWLYNLYGFQADTLEGGYKAFRNFVLEVVNQPRHLLVLGGYTGSRKTEILQQLKRLGQPVLDLEQLASHRGSVFGGVNLSPPPTQEQFENNLARELLSLPDNRAIWIEDESRHIGRNVIPNTLYSTLRSAPIVFLDLKKERRVEYLSELYGSAGIEDLKDLTRKVQDRLGGQSTKEALQALDQGEIPKAAAILLHYYDRSYQYGLEHRSGTIIKRYSFDTESISGIAEILFDYYRQSNFNFSNND